MQAALLSLGPQTNAWRHTYEKVYNQPSWGILRHRRVHKHTRKIYAGTFPAGTVHTLCGTSRNCVLGQLVEAWKRMRRMGNVVLLNMKDYSATLLNQSFNQTIS